MCGIAGIAGAAPDPALLEAMASAMPFRGPDGRGTWAGDRIGLAHRRLAIIDLDDRSLQPMHHDGLHLVYNGEIYNYVELRDELRGAGHSFATESDTEVLLHAWSAWGPGALDRVNGMFSLAVWDERSRELWLAVDPFGEKPLLYVQDGDRLVFGSDVRALAPAVDLGTPDERACARFAAVDRHPDDGATFFGRVRRLPAGHLGRWAGGRLELRPYWTPAEVAVPERYEDAVAELRELLTDSIRLRLRSDVPVGTSLSGGVDSSAVVALSAALAGDHRRHAFTARFPGFERDEWGYAETVAQAAGVVEHHAVEPTAAEALADLGALVADQNEPFGSLSMYAQWRVMRAAREAGVTVLLDGQGADELFGGYGGVVGRALRQMPASRRLAVLRAEPPARREYLLGIAADRLPEAAKRRVRRRTASPYVGSGAVTEGIGYPPPRPRGARRGRPLTEELLRQSFHTSLPQLLRYADRNSMAHSRELRLPFLDRRVAELAWSLPAEFAYRDGRQKAILRDAVRGLVPDVVLERRDKVGFEPPQARWLAEPAARERIAEVLLDPGAGALVDRAAVEADLRAGAWRDHHALWRIVSVELWRRWAASLRTAGDRAEQVATA